MRMRTQGLHHVTAITGDIQRNLGFYIGILGLRLAKRTVIQEEPSTYHLFYGDAVGSVGTDITFFDWPNVGRGRVGARTVVRTLYTVADDAALSWWQARFKQAGIPYTTQQDFAGRSSLYFSDPDGLPLGIVAAGRFPNYQHWRENIANPANALQALHSVTLGVDQLEPTVRYLSEVFGYEVATSFHSSEENEGKAVMLIVGDSGDENSRVGKELVVAERTEAQPGLRGTGSVHHVALTIAPDDSIEAWHERLVATGLKVTQIIRRYYFDAVYVRIPGGILFELATETGPGLAADEAIATLGQTLTLPPFLENQRAQIAAQLKPIVVPAPKSLS
jgi:glyoxalase family protein